MGKMITGSLCLTDIGDAVKAGHSAVSTGKNGKKYLSILVWENDEPDKYNNNFSVQLNATKEAPESERKMYIGNLKYAPSNATPAIGNNTPGGPVKDVPAVDDLPF